MNKKSIYFLIALLLVVLFTWILLNSEKKNEEFSQRVKVTLREVGHQLLLTNDDTTSLVLPVKKIDTLKYQVLFQNKLTIAPKDLALLFQRNFDKSSISQHYIVEVLECVGGEVAYSYEMNGNQEKSIIPCFGRTLDKNCYSITVQFLDSKKTFLSTSTLMWVFGFVIFLVVQFILFRKKDIYIPENKNDAFTSIGDFTFYPKQNRLFKEKVAIKLSKKEGEILAIFVENINQVVKREELEKRVWKDHGVIVGRSLDTYISKLRKIFKEDDSIKLTNAHSVGYTLEIVPKI